METVKVRLTAKKVNVSEDAVATEIKREGLPIKPIHNLSKYKKVSYMFSVQFSEFQSSQYDQIGKLERRLHKTLGTGSFKWDAVPFGETEVKFHFNYDSSQYEIVLSFDPKTAGEAYLIRYKE